MTHAVVTGAGGFIGQALVGQLLARGLHGRPLARITAVDLRCDDLPDDARLRRIEGSLAEADTWARSLAGPVDVVFHLASLPGGAAERDPDLGRRVNLDATLGLVDALRHKPAPVRVVYASSIAVYGPSLPAVVDETATLPSPALSYGTHKLASELLLADAARRGWLTACSLRLPGVVARPGSGEGLISAFMSQLFWKLAAGEPITLPVSLTGTAWWISARACAANLRHAATLDTSQLPPQAFQMPALHLSMQDVIEALAVRFGADRRSLVSCAPNPETEALFARYPPLLTPRADAAGFRHDGSTAELVSNALDMD